jgi:hypothetical protein
MATTRPQLVINEIRDHLQNNIDDPNPSRSSDTDWVYTIPINYDIADYPRIHIQRTSSPQTGFSLGESCRRLDQFIDITIFHGTGRGQKMDIDDDGETEPVNDVVDFLAERVVEEINSNQDKWKDGNTNVQSVKTTNENLLQDTGNSVVQYTVEAEIRIVRGN